MRNYIELRSRVYLGERWLSWRGWGRLRERCWAVDAYVIFALPPFPQRKSSSYKLEVRYRYRSTLDNVLVNVNHIRIANLNCFLCTPGHQSGLARMFRISRQEAGATASPCTSCRQHHILGLERSATSRGDHKTSRTHWPK